jgi:hypothetical protein
VLRDAQNKSHRLAIAEVEEVHPQTKSLMPELLVRDFTAQQLADLLEYLGSLRATQESNPAPSSNRESQDE